MKIIKNIISRCFQFEGNLLTK